MLSRLFLMNKNSFSQNDIALIGNGKSIFEKNALVENFNDHYVNIVEKSCTRVTDNENNINEIMQYKYH